jgi:cytochrome P450
MTTYYMSLPLFSITIINNSPLTRMNIVTVQRLALVPYTFKDRLYIPAGTEINFASRQQSFDSDIYPDAEIFDPKRWQRKRQEIDSHRFHFPSTADDFINWGSGVHACPGRFLADVTLKLIFAHLLSNYEFKHPDRVQSKPTES